MTDQTQVKSERFQRGIAYYNNLHQDSAGEASFDALEAIAPGFADLLIEFTLGDVFTRPGLDVKTRELLTVAGLTAMSTAPLQLKTHIDSALNAGNTKEEIVETITQMAVFAGFPAALNAFFVLGEVLQDRAGKE
ncbi:carboxymuconolactone decarboxylase family protein [Streptomyces iconiensis]|uniref:Carboxymuconolactone decarboxylase family protein n=1 Tax=Streptomyces iconiensis TaxID=1384038 RepID=A0ABT6ZYN8_9ACTN|nr:carboxymuconolactone decarboxylase family protein [Streptomyces iconiensis]MDJ1134181.1 carboxymuconolactone decarboxylase family protein [Streptomyces iconiensis]